MRQTHDLDPQRHLSVELFDRVAKGHGHVGVRFEHHLPTGGVREMRTDLARLEFAAKRAEEYAKSGETEERFEQVGDVELRLKRGDYGSRGDTVGVHLFQKDRHGSGEWQAISMFADDLKKAVSEGQKLEGNLGYDRRWHTVVDANSFTKEADGRIHADAVKSFESEWEAREFLGKNEGYALSQESQRREFARGEKVELWADAKVVVEAQTHARGVGEQLGLCEWSRERQSDRYVVAELKDMKWKPRVGEIVTYQGTGFGFNGDPMDYQVGKASRMNLGETGGPRWGLIEKDPRQPGQGKLVADSSDRKAMTRELAEREQRGVDNKRDGTIDSKEDSFDLTKESFKMDRQQYRQGHSM